MDNSIKKYFVPGNYSYKLKKIILALCGNIFTNPGPVKDQDIEQIRQGIDEVNPEIFIEIGTGTGVSTRNIYGYLQKKVPQCEFYTIEIYKDYYTKIKEEFCDCATFHAILGLSVNREDTTKPAYMELALYFGPTNTLRDLVNHDMKNKKIDIVFIDSRIGTSLPEFLFLKDHMSPNGIIFCHDVYEGKGIEVLEYLKKHNDEFLYEVIDTEYGMLKIRNK
jgi:predicted O-methyltransferase YrrM